jgi:peptidyl-prolyl cis-trans isomerase D
MLNQLRQGAQGWLSKLLMGLLVLSFAIWGIGGFQGYGAGTIATVGNEEVTVQEFASLYDRAQRNVQAGRRVEPDQVLAQLLLTAALDDEAGRYGLGISERRVAAEIAKTPAFHDASGNFDRERFESLLMNSRIDRDEYIHDVRSDLVRGQLAGAVSTGMQVPQPMVEAIYRFRNEERAVSYVAVDETAIEPVGDPSEAELQAYFEENKAEFRAPEYRELALLTLDAAEIADPSKVSEEAVKAEYERRKANFEQPERRRVEQVVFADAVAANSAVEEVKGGKDLPEVAQSHGAAVTDLGLKTKAEFLDPAVAEAAFAAAPETPVAVTEGALQPSIIRVTSIEPGSVTPLSQVESRIRQEIATRTAREQVNDVYDQVEDERAGGSTLEETATKLALPYRRIEAVAPNLTAPDGSAVTGIPSAGEVIKEAFDTDIGIENSPIRAGGDAWVFYEVTNVEPARDRSLDEVREAALAAWKTAETEKRISERAEALFDDLKNGKDLSAIATGIGKTVQSADGLKRSGQPPEGLTGNAVNQAFAGPEGHVANAEGAGGSRILLKVDRVIAPAFFAEAPEVEQVKQQLSTALQNDILSTFNAQLRSTREVHVNNAAYQQVAAQLGASQVPQQ